MSKSEMTRRGFLATGSLAALTPTTRWMSAAIHESTAVRSVFVSSMGSDAGVSLYDVLGDQWSLNLFVPCDAPIAIALHPKGHTLYVVHEVDSFRGMPCGYISSYRIDPKNRSLRMLGETPLSLSAVMPRQLAVSPDGTRLAVAVRGGGAYNLLSIREDGSLDRVSSVLKETGRGPVAGQHDSAHPQNVVFGPSGKHLIGVDSGCDHLRVLVLAMRDALQFHSRCELNAGSGPSHLVLHPKGHLVYTGHTQDGTILGFRYDDGVGAILEEMPGIHGEESIGALAMHPSGNFLYSADRKAITVWSIDGETGRLAPMESIRLAGVRGLHLPSNRADELLALTTAGIVPIALRLDGRIARILKTIDLAGATSIAALHTVLRTGRTDEATLQTNFSADRRSGLADASRPAGTT